MRKALALLGLVAALLAALALYRRALPRSRERIDLYFDDGSMISLGDGSPDAARLLPLAREAIRAARS